MARPSSLQKNPYIFSVLINHTIWLNLNLNKWCSATPPSGMALLMSISPFSAFFSVTRRSRSDSRQSLTDSLTESVSVSTDLIDVTLVSNDTYWRLDWCYSSNWGSYQAMKVFKWWKLSSDESYQVMKLIKWWKLSSDESYLVMKVILWWKFACDES